MPVTRMDLADCGSPEKLVSTILKHEPNLPIAVPIEELCTQLELTIETRETDGFIGALITDAARSRGVIIVKKGLSRERRRFTIGHELGHSLILAHALDGGGGFWCTSQDISRRSLKHDDPRMRREAEASRFSALMLMPPPALRQNLNRDPDLEHMARLARDFQVSKEAMARAYSEYHSEAIAFVLVDQGTVLRVYRNRNFPALTVEKGSPIPGGSFFNRGQHKVGVASRLVDVVPGLWIDIERGQQAPEMYEQVYLQQKGHALIMLWYEAATEDEQDEDENRTSKERWRDRQDRFQR